MSGRSTFQRMAIAAALDYDHKRDFVKGANPRTKSHAYPCSTEPGRRAKTAFGRKFCKTFRQMRIAAGLELREVEKHLGLSYSCATHWESGRSHPTFELFPKIAKLFGVEVADLFR